MTVRGMTAGLFAASPRRMTPPVVAAAAELWGMRAGQRSTETAPTQSGRRRTGNVTRRPAGTPTNY